MYTEHSININRLTVDNIETYLVVIRNVFSAHLKVTCLPLTNYQPSIVLFLQVISVTSFLK